MNGEDEFQESKEMAEVAEELGEQHQKDVHLPDSESIERYPVFGADASGDDEVSFVIQLGPDLKETISIPWPDDTTDHDEPLVRFLELYDVSPRNVTDIDDVLVYTDGYNNFEPVIPPKKDDNSLVYRSTRLHEVNIEVDSWNNVEATLRKRSEMTIFAGLVAAMLSFGVFASLYMSLVPFEVLTLKWRGVLFLAMFLLLLGVQRTAKGALQIRNRTRL